jgi:AcrR family transcriptional regulator
VEAAARILEEEGHSHFSTNAVADRAGVSIGSLYQYFPGKDAIMGALLRRETGLLIAEAEAALRANTGREAIRILISASIAHQFRRPRLARLLDFEEAHLPPSPDTQGVMLLMIDLARQALMRPDAPRQTDVSVAARDMIAIMKGMIDTEGSGDTPDPKALQARVQRAVLGYLGRPA